MGPLCRRWQKGVLVLCRLLGYVASHPMSVIDLLGKDAFDAFTSLTVVHGDGWGMAWQDPVDGSTNVANSPVSAAEDALYADLAGQPLAAAGMVHLRWATGGLAVTPANTHPFVDGDFALAHNGHISPIGRLEDLLKTNQRAKLVGETDSERYFRFVLQCIDESGDEADGVLTAVRTLHTEFPESSLNALLLTRRRLFAIHVNARAHAPSKALRSIFGLGTSMPAGHEDQYFEMAYRVSPQAVYVISSGLTEPGWSPVQPDNAVMIDLTTRGVTRLDPLGCSELSDEPH